MRKLHSFLCLTARLVLNKDRLWPIILKKNELQTKAVLFLCIQQETGVSMLSVRRQAIFFLLQQVEKTTCAADEVLNIGNQRACAIIMHIL